MTALNSLIDNIYTDMLSDVHEAQGEPVDFASEPDFIVDEETPMEPLALTLLEAVVESVAFFSQPGIVVTLGAVIDRLRNTHGIDNIERNGRVSDCVALVNEGVEAGVIVKGQIAALHSVALTPAGRELAVERGWATQTCLRCNDALREVDISEDGWCEDCVSIVNAIDKERFDDAQTSKDFDDTPPDMRYGTAEREIERDGESSPVFFYRAAMGKATLVDAIEGEGCRDYLSGLKNNKQRAQFLNDLRAATARLQQEAEADALDESDDDTPDPDFLDEGCPSFATPSDVADEPGCLCDCVDYEGVNHLERCPDHPEADDDESDAPLTFGDLAFGEFARTKQGALRMYVRPATNSSKVAVVRQCKDGTWTTSSVKADAPATLVKFADDADERLSAYAAMTRKDRDALLTREARKSSYSHNPESAPAISSEDVQTSKNIAAAEEAEWRKAATLAAFPELAFGYVDEDESDLPAVGHEFGDCDDRSYALEQRIKAQDERIKIQDDRIDERTERIDELEDMHLDEMRKRVAQDERIEAQDERIDELERRLDATLAALSEMTSISLSLRQIDHPGFK